MNSISRTNLSTYPINIQSSTALISSIADTTTVEKFSKEMEKHPGYKLDMLGLHGTTVLSTAALVGNVALITFIVETGGKDLLYLEDVYGAPLHSACVCSNLENGYLAAKRLIQLGSPVNIANVVEQENSDGSIQLDFKVTPLEMALLLGNIQITTLLLRLGGIARLDHCSEKSKATLEAAKKEIMTENEKLFKMGICKHVLSTDVVNHILSISSKLV